MAKDTFYFSHDYNSRGDRKMVSLLMNCGIEGIGIYWCIIEMLYEEGGYLMQSECERIAFELRTDCDLVAKVMRSTLFCRNDENFWSESVLKRLEKRKEISGKASNSAHIRWENEKSMRTHSDRNANKGKESKRKEKNSLNNSSQENSKNEDLERQL